MLKKCSVILFFALLLANQLSAKNDCLFLASGIRVCAKPDHTLLVSNLADQVIDRQTLEGEIRHMLLIGRQRLSVQTSKFNYIYQIDEKGIEIERKLNNPFDSKGLDNYFFLKWEGKEVIFTEKGGAVEVTFHKTDMERPRHFRSYIPATRKRPLKGEKQTLLDYKAGYLYLNLSNSESFLFVNTNSAVMGNRSFKGVSGLDYTKFGNWYFDVKSERCYLLVNSGRSSKLFKYDNGGIEKKGGRRTGKVVVYRDVKSLMESGMLVEQIGYVPLVIHANDIWEDLGTKRPLKN